MSDRCRDRLSRNVFTIGDRNLSVSARFGRASLPEDEGRLAAALALPDLEPLFRTDRSMHADREKLNRLLRRLSDNLISLAQARLEQPDVAAEKHGLH